MSLRLYLKDGTNSLIPGVTSAKPYPEDDNFIAGLAGDGSIIALVPTENIIAVVDEN